MGFTLTPTDLPEVNVVEGPRFGDHRGFFCETFREEDFAKAGIPTFVQHNHSRSEKGVLRGLHFQIEPAPLGKLVRCSRGKILDVAVDVRQGSPRYGRHVMVEIDDEHNRMLWIPPGFAHGFLTVSEVADVIYMQTGYWSPEHERSLAYDDPTVGIPWPEGPFKVSAKDEKAPRLADIDSNFVFRG